MGLKEWEEAYRKTIYACPQRGAQLILGHNNSLLDDILNQENCTDLCILTAYNPFSRIHSELENVRNQLRLKEKLSWLGYSMWEGVNIDPDGVFPEEATWWVPGMPVVEGKILGREWNQNAIVYYTRSRKTELIWCNSVQ